ncbi:MAG: response regulator transcription factor [Candidatus Acidiferrales bacterium]
MRAFIVTASPLVRAGLENILAAQGVEVAGAFASVEPLTDHLVEETADVVLIDASGEEFESLLRNIELSELTSETAVILLADHPAPRWLAEAVRAGIGAILPSGAAPEQLVAAMQAATAGLFVMNRGQIDSAFPAASPASQPLELAEPLTRREREVLQMLASGLGNKEIATRLTISEHTVKFHVASILGKLGAASRTEAVAQGIRHGFVLL